MAGQPLKVVVFLSSVRPNRMAERIAKYLTNAITAKGMEPIIFDPLEMRFEILQLPIHFMATPADAPQWLREANETIQAADAFLIASAEYNGNLPPALSNMIDHFPPASYRHRPCGILTYSMGAFGGIRVGTLLRVLVAELGMYAVPSSVVIPTIQSTVSEEGVVGEEKVVISISKQLEELQWLAKAIKNYANVEPLPPS